MGLGSGVRKTKTQYILHRPVSFCSWVNTGALVVDVDHQGLARHQVRRLHLLPEAHLIHLDVHHGQVRILLGRILPLQRDLRATLGGKPLDDSVRLSVHDHVAHRSLLNPSTI